MKNKVIISLSVILAVFSAAIITLGVFLGRTIDNCDTANAMLEAHYQQAYFTLLDETNDMEIKLAKLTVSNSPKNQSELLRDISKSAEVSANCLAALSSADVTVTYTMRFINQTGDFAKYLTDTLESGETLSAEHKTSLDKIYRMFITLGSELNKVKSEITAGNLFVDNINDKNSVLSTVFSGLNEASVEYPQLIYDGPFSDALNDKEAKGLSGEDLDELGGQTKINEIFGDKVSNIEFMGEWNSDIATLNYNAKVSGNEAYIQLSKKGGMLLSYSAYRDVTDPSLSDDECAELARQFLVKAGFDNMQAVWHCNDNSTVYINFAPIDNGVILYPDLVKVKVASDNGEILGLEARSYAFNHTTRTIPSPELSPDEAKNRLNLDGDVSGGALTLIPYKTNSERLAYEFKAVRGGTYYIYIDALSGEELNIFYVISTLNGDKLI